MTAPAGRTFVIAEPGSTAGPDLDRLIEMIEIAARAGATSFKAQWTSDPARLAARRNVPEYVEAYRPMAWPVEWHARLRSECERRSLEYMCTVYLSEDIAVVAPHIQRFKIASFEADDKTFIRAHLAYGKPLVVSVAWDDRVIHGVKDGLFLLCTAAYPAPMESLCLGAMRSGFSGLSDHTANVLTGAFAVCAGAAILEVHYRHPATLPDHSDYPHSHSPESLLEYVRLVRLAEQAMGDGIKKMQDCERPWKKFRVKT